MRAEYFDLTLTVPVVVRFLCAGLRGVFFAPGGRMRAAGLLRKGLCARLSQRRGRVGARGGRSASRAKAPGTSPGASFLSPLSLAIQRKGAQGRRGRAAPEDWRGIPYVTCYELGKTHLSDAALLGRALGGGRATLGPTLQHRPYPERNSQPRQWVEIFITMRHHGLREMELHD